MSLTLGKSWYLHALFTLTDEVVEMVLSMAGALEVN